ncbi:ion transporter [Flavobacterium sp. U410]
MKKWLYDILENDQLNDGKKFLFDIFLAVIIILSIVPIFIENSEGELPFIFEKIDEGIMFFFITEFLLRFYVASNFREDLKNKGLKHALIQKLRWFTQWKTVIDFLAIIPSIKFFRVFRTLRFLRLFRIFRIYRSIKTFREIDKIFIILKGMKEESRVWHVFLSFTIFFMFVISFALYISERGTQDSEFQNFKDSIWYSVKVLGFGDDTPKTIFGKFFAALLLLINMAIFGFFVSIILNKIQNTMEVITSGKIGKIKLENHIVICGYTKSSQNVIEDLLQDKNNINRIVLITRKKVQDDIHGVIYVNDDYTELDTLLKVNIAKAKFAIVFAEPKEHDTIKDVDLRTVMTIFNIEKEAPNVHTIAEINDERNAEIIKDKIEGDEILYKELIDSKIISSCINHKHLSNMFYELFGTEKSKRLFETDLETILLEGEANVKNIKFYFIDKNATFLGYIDEQNKSFLSPKNDVILNNSHRLIYILDTI